MVVGDQHENPGVELLEGVSDQREDSPETRVDWLQLP